MFVPTHRERYGFVDVVRDVACVPLKPSSNSVIHVAIVARTACVDGASECTSTSDRANTSGPQQRVPLRLLYSVGLESWIYGRALRVQKIVTTPKRMAVLSSPVSILVFHVIEEVEMRILAASLAMVVSATLYAQPTQFQRGDLVRVKPVVHGSDVATLMPLRVVAIPGDRLRIADEMLYVNDVPVSGFSRDLMNRVAQQPDRVPSVVPIGHCFVIGEQRTDQDIDEYWGQHSELRLERDR